MKAYEFPAQTTADGKLKLPDAVLPPLPSHQTVRVIVLFNEPTDTSDQAAWSSLTTERFFAGYSQADAVYDEL